MYHLTDEGDPKPCKASKVKCPYSYERHFSSEKEARAAYEAIQNGELPKVSRTVKHEMKLSVPVLRLMDQLHNENLQPYIVGGSVRDSLISGTEPKDIDIEVFGVDAMDELENILKKNRYRVDSVGKSFGVLKLQVDSGEDIDISLPRRDSKTGDGHRGFEVQVDPHLTLEEAAGRRDFTINALYYSPKESIIRDPFGGVSDWNKKELRHINEHFGEDPLRVIRGVQFAARFNMNLAAETAELARSMRKEFANLSEDRIQTEFEKLFTKGDVVKGFQALRETGWDHEMKLSKVEKSAIEESAQAIIRAREEGEDVAVFGTARILSSGIEKNNSAKVSSLLLKGLKRQQKALKLPLEKTPETLNEKTVRAWARDLGKRGLTVKDYYIYSGDSRVKTIAKQYNVYEHPDPDLVTGAQVLEQSGGKPGPWIGKLLQEANKAQDERIFIDAAGAKQWLQNRLKQMS